MAKQAVQYTLRDVPPDVDRALRKRARATGESLNRVAIEALAAGVGEGARTYDDLDFLVGTMTPAEASRVEREIAAQRRIDPDLWK